jgi:uncharacterized protein (DUF1499 family)
MDKFRDWVVRAALGLALFLPLYFLIAALGVKFGLFEWRLGLVDLTLNWGMKGLVPFVLGVASIAVALAYFTPPRRGVGTALAALLIPAAILGYGFYMLQQSKAIPPIHDISTDTENPPGFSEEVKRARAAVAGGNDLDLLPPDIEAQQRHYSDLTAVTTGLAPAQALEVVADIANEQSWRVSAPRTDAADAENRIVEAVAETFWFGFKDDIAIRVQPEGSGARIDMRSVSRVGVSDLGANAARMRPFLAALRTRLQEAEEQEPPALAPPREGSEADTPAPPPP